MFNDRDAPVDSPCSKNQERYQGSAFRQSKIGSSVDSAGFCEGGPRNVDFCEGGPRNVDSKPPVWSKAFRFLDRIFCRRLIGQ